MITMFGFDDESSFKDDAHKLLIGLVIGFGVRWLWDLYSGEDGAKVVNQIILPPSDKTQQRIEVQIPDGLAGIERTLDVMSQLVRRDAHSEYVRQLASALVSDCVGHDFVCEIKKLYLYARSGIRYRRDPVGQERVQDCRRTVQYGVGDCDDKSVLLASLLAALGHKPAFVVLGRNPDKFTHVYVAVRTPTGWVPLDPTPESAKAGWQAKGHRRMYAIFK